MEIKNNKTVDSIIEDIYNFKHVNKYVVQPNEMTHDHKIIFNGEQYDYLLEQSRFLNTIVQLLVELNELNVTYKDFMKAYKKYHIQIGTFEERLHLDALNNYLNK